MSEIDAERGQGFDGVGKEAFAAGFVDGGLHCIGDVNFQALKRGRYGAGEACRAGSGNEEVDLFCMRAKVHRETRFYALSDAVRWPKIQG